MRIRSRWKNKGRARTIEENAGALAFIEWRIAGQALLNLENEGFQTDTQLQRLAVLQELSAFLIHVTDRLVHGDLDDEQRQKFIVALALKMADTYHDNRVDSEGRGQDFRPGFIDTLNQRLADYAECSFDNGEPGYQFKRFLGECVTNTMGEKDRKWISDQVMEIEVPDMLKTLKKGLGDLFETGKAADAPPTQVGEGE
ncbi:hypothetical protein DFR30_1771 [Thiogranum longum]|uniref:Uncharacterized protein n=1 Tax=Thiogranum longum TaxID=1537524 RepID=A0A4R1HD23_9GAMM|nr:hypothetical protein [Thiogranum longum]TCK18493.1 hypothetical protein DFR30_1771 [Thiogranum longum]